MRQGGVLIVVDRSPVTHLGGDLDEVERKHRSGREFAGVRRSAIGGPAGRNVIEQSRQRAQFLIAVLYQACATDDDDRPVFQRVVQRRASQYQAVHQGDGDADRQALPGSGRGEHRAAAGGSVQVQDFAQPRVGRG